MTDLHLTLVHASLESRKPQGFLCIMQQAPEHQCFGVAWVCASEPFGELRILGTPWEGGSAHSYPRGFFTSRADLSAGSYVCPHLLPNVPFLSLRHRLHMVATHFCQAAFIYLCISHGELFCLQVFSERPGSFSRCCQIISFLKGQS